MRKIKRKQVGLTRTLHADWEQTFLCCSPDLLNHPCVLLKFENSGLHTNHLIDESPTVYTTTVSNAFAIDGDNS
ncbi:hypothetical protein RRG08_000634 [Elysia crispata]|uniref:Uncharacterized protein n=1 Tax=Elysia crispata TaxID=231223 RepID=A0AAE0Y8G9_9GAST|nr:hypothetical protein RRG08_000634 [Elysia crispata]